MPTGPTSVRFQGLRPGFVVCFSRRMFDSQLSVFYPNLLLQDMVHPDMPMYGHIAHPDRGHGVCAEAVCPERVPRLCAKSVPTVGAQTV